MTIEEKVEQFLSPYLKNTFIIACSGGVDSLSLLHLLHHKKYSIEVAHVNYQLRGIDSDLDQQIISEYCEKNKIPFHLKKIDLGSELAKHGGNLQDKARNIRFKFFQDLTENTNKKILLAHHLEDQIETFFINLANNGSLLGMSSMLSVNGDVLRPFLLCSKEEIKQYAQENKLLWREDISNSKNDYQRNKLRNEFIPSMLAKFPELPESVLTIINVFQENQRSIAEKISPLAKEIKKSSKISIQDYLNLNSLEKHELFRQLMLPYGVIIELDKLSKSQKGKKINLIHMQYQSIVKDELFFILDKYEISKIPKLIIEKVNSLPKIFDKQTIYLDPSKIKGELILRKWQIGDRIKPIGMQGSKLISDIITDAKISSSSKKNQFVLCDDEKIICCINHAISREAIASEKSEIIKVNILF